MKIISEPTGTINGFQQKLEEMAADESVKGLLILSGGENDFSPQNINPILKGISKPLFGGTFNGVIHDQELIHKGSIIIGLDEAPRIHIIPKLSDANIDYDNQLEELMDETDDLETMFVFVDGYSSRISSLMHSLFDIFGVNSNNYLGGGAGIINADALDIQAKPCLFTNEGFINDSAVLAFSKLKSGIGIRHGWHKVSGPFKVTESDGNVIHTIDWKPAFELYSEEIKNHSGKVITKDNFFNIAKGYPFGINRIDSETIVRDPFTFDGGSLILAAPVPNESFIDILTGDISTLIEAAESASKASLESIKGNQQEITFLVDCVSRYLYYGDDFNKEIEAIKQPDVPLVGILSMGEIANWGRDYMEFYNKTCVVGTVYKK